jgi:ornithine decarboxylase
MSNIIQDDFIDFSTFINTKKIKQIQQDIDIYDLINLFLEEHKTDDAFFIINLGDILRQFHKWKKFLPNIEPFYAVKCNPDIIILELLAKLGCSFDCASKNEIAKVMKLDVKPEQIIYANPIKQINQIKYARACDIDLLTFDCANELYKIKLYHPKAKLVVRIKTDDSNSVCRFSSKFGVDVKEVENLISMAKGLTLDITGVSFHCGSGCKSVESYRKAIKDCREVYDIAKKYGFTLSLVDLGGGFPGIDSSEISFEAIATTINESINNYFDNIDIRFIAEPGRFFVSSSHTIVMSIISKKEIINDKDEREISYTVSDGVYGSFNNVIYDHYIVNQDNLYPFNERNEQKYKSTIFGPTCDSIDKITDDILLPDLALGEYIYCVNMGAYTTALFHGVEDELFNGFSKTKAFYVIN